MLGLYNTKGDLRSRLEKIFDICGLDQLEVAVSDDNIDLPSLTGLFVDWKKKEDDELSFAHQAVIVENYVKAGIPVIIFDRHLKLSLKEYNWLKKFNTTFFEPVIKGRPGFEYFPFWTEKFEKDWFSYSTYDRVITRKYDLGYIGNVYKRIKPFEKYFADYARLYPKNKVSIFTESRHVDNKLKEWTDNNIEVLEERPSFRNIGFTILIGTRSEYESGYLRSDLFDIMKDGCIPILPIEHRFYGTVFKEMCARNIKDLNFLLSLHSVRGVIIEEIQDNFLKYFPECNIKTAVERIERCLRI